MKYNIYSNVKTDPTEAKLAALKPIKIGTAIKQDVFLFRDKIAVEKQMQAAINCERMLIFGSRG